MDKPFDAAELDRLEAVCEAATPGEWTVYGERIDSNRMLAAEEALAQVNLTEQVSSHFWMLNADGKCPALTGCGPTSEANAAHIAAMSPATAQRLIAMARESLGLREAFDYVCGLLPSGPSPLEREADTYVLNCMINVGELRRVKEFRAALRPTTDGGK